MTSAPLSPPAPPASGFTYAVTREQPESVREDLCRLWSANLNLAESADDKFRWLYREAPDPGETVFVLRARDAAGAERAVGTSGVAVRRFQLGRSGREGRAGVSCDLAVDLAHRGLLPALRLVRAVQEYVSTTFDVTYGFPNGKAQGVMLRGGFRLLGKATRWVRVLRHAPYASRLGERPGVPAPIVRIASNPLAARVGGALVDVARLAQGARGVADGALRYRFAWERGFDGRFDALWRDARSGYEVVGARTSAFLAWRCRSGEVATITRRGGELAAYAIVEIDPKTDKARIADVFGHESALAPLLDLLLPALWARGVVSVAVSFLGAPRFQALLEARGFEERGDPRTIVVHAGAGAPDAAELTDAKRWHLFDIDEDT